MKPLYFFLLLAFLSLNANTQNTYVPDDNFEQALIDLGYDSGALDNYVPTANISAVSWLNVSNKAISDLTGIEDFSSLMILEVANNNLTSLSVNFNTQLTILLCYNNSLTSLDVSNNTSLITLMCYTNSLNYLDVSNNIVLSTLSVFENNLTSLDISNNTELANFSCHTNSLTSLDVSNNASVYYLSCHTNNLTSLDVNHNTELTTILCNNNSLTTLDFSNNIELTTIVCDNNNLTSLDVRNNIVLDYLMCHSNNLTRLNLSNNKLLDHLSCSNNELIGINLRGVKTGNVSYFNSLNNPDLECIQVDDPAYCEALWTNIDPTSSFRKNCRYNANYSREGLIDSGNESFDNSNLSVYPNPVKEVMAISSKINGSFSIVNSNGQILKQGIFSNGNNEIDLSQFEQGLYFLHLKSETDSMLKKIIKN